MFQDLEAQMLAERERLTKEKDAVQAELDKVQNDLSTKLSKAEFEVNDSLAFYCWIQLSEILQ